MKESKMLKIVHMDKNNKFAVIESHTQEELKEAITELEAMQERIKELEAENEDLLQQVNDYEQFSEIISEPKETHE